MLGFSGKKSAGKNVGTNFIFGNIMKSLGLIQQFEIDEKGQLVVDSVTSDGIVHGIMNPLDTNPQSIELYAKYVWPFVKVYSFADPLKEFLINVLGLTPAQCYGTDEEKNSFTKLCWEDMPGTYIPMEAPKFNAVQGRWIGEKLYGVSSGPMTGRDVMQYFGTNICRRMYNNVWVDATIRRIIQEGSALAVISDIRFPNEVKGIQEAGGKVIRLLRAPFVNQDEHTSETALDNYTEDQFDAVLDNREMSIIEQCQATGELLEKWGWNEF